MPPPPTRSHSAGGRAHKTRNVHSSNNVKGPAAATGILNTSAQTLRSSTPSSLNQQQQQQQRLLPSSHYRSSSSPLGGGGGGGSRPPTNHSGSGARLSMSIGGGGGGATKPSTAMSSVLSIGEVERLKAANSRQKARPLEQTELSRGDEMGDREVLDLHKAVFKRLEGGAIGSILGGGGSNTFVPVGAQHRTAAVGLGLSSSMASAPSSSATAPLAPISKMKGVEEALAVARIVANASKVDRLEGATGKGGHSAGGEEERRASHDDNDDDEGGDRGGRGAGGSTMAIDNNTINDKKGTAAANAMDMSAIASTADGAIDLSAFDGAAPLGASTSAAQQQQPVSYFDRVAERAPAAEKLSALLATEMAHHSTKYKSGSALVDGCRDELERFLTLEAATISNTTPVTAEQRLATLFPHQSRQWKEVLEQTRKDGHLRGVTLMDDPSGEDAAANKARTSAAATASGGPTTDEASTDRDKGYSLGVRRNIQREVEDVVSQGVMDRYKVRTGIDKAFSNLPTHRLVHLQQEVFKLSVEELESLGDTTQLLQSKGEVQRLLQGANTAGKQAELDSMREWTSSVMHANKMAKAFEESLEKQRVGPDGCITANQLKQCLQAAGVAPGPRAMERFMRRVDPSDMGRLRVTAVRDAWAEGELRLGLEPIELHEARACLDLVVPAARQALGLTLTPPHIMQWMGRLGTAIDIEDAEAFLAKHKPLTCEKALRHDVFADVQGLWFKAKSKSNDAVSEVGLHQRLRELETGQAKWDVAMDDLDRHANAMQSGFGALNSLQSEMDRQAKKVRLLAQLMPTKYARTVAVNTDITYPCAHNDDASDDEGGGRPSAGGGSLRKGGMPAWGRRRTSTASSTTAPGGDTPRGTGSSANTPGSASLAMDSMHVGANAVVARDRLVEDLQQHVKNKNAELVRIRVLYEGYRFKAESSIRNANLLLQVKEAELAQLTDRLASYEMFEDASEAAGAVASPEERMQEIQAHFLKKMRESEASHQEEVRAFAKEIQTARNTFEEQKHALLAELNECKDTNVKHMERIRHMEGEVATREEALNANEHTASNLAMNLKLVTLEVDTLRVEAQNNKDRARMLEEQLTMARKTQQLYVPREEMERRLREKEAEYQLKMGTEVDSREKMQEELKVAKDKLHAATMNEAEVRASAEKRINTFRIDLERVSSHRQQLLSLLKDTIAQWFESVVSIRKGLATEVELASDLFPWLTLQLNLGLQTMTETAQSASKHVMEIAQGADANTELIDLLREARKESSRAFPPPKDNIASERDALEAQLANALRDTKEAGATARDVTSMLAVYKCAVLNLEDTLGAVMDAVVSAAKGDDRAINKYNLTGPGAAEVAEDRMGEAVKAFVPRRMPVSIPNAMELVGGEDGLKNKTSAAGGDGNGTVGGGGANSPDAKMTFAARMASRKAASANGAPQAATSKASGDDASSEASPISTAGGGVSLLDGTAARPFVASYDPPMALQTLSQGLHSVQMGVFSALGMLSGRFTVLNAAVEQSGAQAMAALASASEARQALKRQIDRSKQLDDEDELDALIRERRSRRGEAGGEAGGDTSAADDSLVAFGAAPILESLLWANRNAVSAIAVTVVRPVLAKARELYATSSPMLAAAASPHLLHEGSLNSTSNSGGGGGADGEHNKGLADTPSSYSSTSAAALARLDEVEQRLVRAREPYVRRLMQFMVALRGANRWVKRSNKAYTDAMFSKTAPSSSSPSHMSNSGKAPKVSVEELRGRSVKAKEAHNAVIMKASRELAPLLDRFHTALWNALSSGERALEKAQQLHASASASAAAAPQMVDAAANPNPINNPNTNTNNNKLAATKSIAKSANATPLGNHHLLLGAKANPNNNKGSAAGRTASTNRPKLPSASAVQKGDHQLTRNASSDLMGGVVLGGGGDSAFATPMLAGDGAVDGILARQRSFDEAFKAFELDGDHHTFISSGSSSVSSSSSSSSSSSQHGDGDVIYPYAAGARHDDGDGEEGDYEGALGMTGTLSIGRAWRDEPSGKEVREVGTQATTAPRRASGGGANGRDRGKKGGGGGDRHRASSGKNSSAQRSRSSAATHSRGGASSEHGFLQATVSMGAQSNASKGKGTTTAAAGGKGGKKGGGGGGGGGGSSPTSRSTTPRLQHTQSIGKGGHAGGEKSGSPMGKKALSTAATNAAGGKHLNTSATAMSDGGAASRSASKQRIPNPAAAAAAGEGGASHRQNSLNNNSSHPNVSSAAAAGGDAKKRPQSGTAAAKPSSAATTGAADDRRAQKEREREARHAALKAKLEGYETLLRELRHANKSMEQQLKAMANTNANNNNTNSNKAPSSSGNGSPSHAAQRLSAAGLRSPQPLAVDLGDGTGKVAASPSSHPQLLSSAPSPLHVNNSSVSLDDVRAPTASWGGVGEKHQSATTGGRIAASSSSHAHRSGPSEGLGASSPSLHPEGAAVMSSPSAASALVGGEGGVRGGSPTSAASKAEAVKARREAMERLERDRKEAAVSEKALRVRPNPLSGANHASNGGASGTPSAHRTATSPRPLSTDPDLEGTHNSSSAAADIEATAASTIVSQSDTNLPSDLRYRENRISSAARSRPLRPMSGGTVSSARAHRPLHREDSDPDLSAFRPSSASLGADRGAAVGGGVAPNPYPMVPQQLQFVPHYLRPSMATSSTQTDLRDLMRAGVAGGGIDGASGGGYPFIPVAQRVRSWEDIQRDMEAQEAEAVRRMGRVLYSNVVGNGSVAGSSSSTLKAQVTTAKVPSYHLSPPPSKAFCGLKYKEVLVEDERFEAEAPSRAASLDVIFSSLPAECRIIAAKYSMLAMFGGGNCVLSADFAAFEHHLLRYHFSPHSHIGGPRHDRDTAVLRQMHADLVAIGHVLLTGEFEHYARRCAGGGGRASSPTSVKKGPAGNNASAAGNASSVLAAVAAEKASAGDPSVAGEGGAPPSSQRCWVNIERYNDPPNPLMASSGGDDAHSPADGSATPSGGVAVNGFDEAVRQFVASDASSGLPMLGTIVGGPMIEGKRFMLAGQPPVASFSMGGVGVGGRPSTSTALLGHSPQPFRVQPLPTPSSMPGPSHNRGGEALPIQLEVVPTASSSSGVNASIMNGGRMPPMGRLSASAANASLAGGGGGAPSPAAVATLAALPLRASTPSFTSHNNTSNTLAMSDDPKSPFRNTASSSSPQQHYTSSDSFQPFASASASKGHTAKLRAIASGQPNKGTLAVEKALRAAMADNASVVATPPLTVARVLRDGGKGPSSASAVSAGMRPVVSGGASVPSITKSPTTAVASPTSGGGGGARGALPIGGGSVVAARGPVGGGAKPPTSPQPNRAAPAYSDV